MSDITKNKISEANKGQLPSNTKINISIANKIREEYKNENLSQLEISKKYNLSQATISLIILNKRWVS